MVRASGVETSRSRRPRTAHSVQAAGASVGGRPASGMGAWARLAFFGVDFLVFDMILSAGTLSSGRGIRREEMVLTGTDVDRPGLGGWQAQTGPIDFQRHPEIARVPLRRWFPDVGHENHGGGLGADDLDQHGGLRAIGFGFGRSDVLERRDRCPSNGPRRTNKRDRPAG